MEIQSILINTYNADHALRLEAEANLSQLLKFDGVLLQLLSFVGNRDFHRDLRQAASIVVKNRIREFWSAKPTDELLKVSVVGDGERATIRTHIVPLLLTESDNSIRTILADIIRGICEYDYPENWPSLLDELLTAVKTANANILQMFNSLLALRKIVKRYEYKTNEQREPLIVIITESFPILQGLMNTIISNNSIEAAQVMRVCLKIFYSATMYALPQTEGVDTMFWFNAFSHIIAKRLPEASEAGAEPQGQPQSAEDRKQWPWWKLKKWALRIACLFIQRYGNPRFSQYKEFAAFFRGNIGIMMLQSVMASLSLKIQGAFVTEEVHRQSLAYVSSCVEMSPTYKVLKPHMDVLLFQIIFPTICISPEDVELLKHDPQEFIRKVHDPMEDWQSATTAATNLLQTLARYRQKDTLHLFLQFVYNLLTAYAATKPEERNFQQKDGVLTAMATLYKIMRDSKAYAGQVQPFLNAHVIPEFQSPVAFIRYRVCWFISFLDEGDYKDQRTLEAILNGLLAGLRDKSIAVQAAAAGSIQHLIGAKGAKELLRPHLERLIGEYFRIMGEVENESVLSALQTIVDTFGHEVQPLAPTMIQHLLTMFHQYFQAANDDDDASFCASQCMDTITCIVEHCEDSAQLPQVEAQLLPMLHALLASNDECYEYIDAALQIINFLTYFSKEVSPGLWSLCGPLLNALDTWAADYINDIMTPIINYIERSFAVFATVLYKDVPLVVMLLKVVEKHFQASAPDGIRHAELLSEESVRDGKSVATMLSCMILAASKCPGSLDPYLGKVGDLVFNKIAVTKNRGFLIMLLEDFLAMIYYSINGTIAILQSLPPGGMDSLFSALFANVKQMKTSFSRRLIVLAFTEILKCENRHLLPSVVTGNLVTMFQQVIREIVLLEEEAEKENEGDDDDVDINMDDDFDDEDDDDEEDGDVNDDNEDDNVAVKKALSRAAKLEVPDGGYDEEEDCVNAEDEEYLQMLEDMEKAGTGKKGGSKVYVDGDLVDQDEDDDDFDDYLYTSEIVEMDLVCHFVAQIRALQTQQAPFIGGIISHLESEDAQRLNALFNMASERSSKSSSE